MSTETYYPINGRITLYSYNHHSKPVRLTGTAITDFEGDSVRLSNWKINDARSEVTLTVVNGYGIHERIFPCEVKEEALPKPGRNFRWSEFGGCWVNQKTGVRVINV